MRPLSPAGQNLIQDIAQRHGFSVEATTSMLEAVIQGHGSMAQFSHPEFAGSGQWMRGGMTMVSDMFNHALASRVDRLCSELADVVANQPDLLRSGSFQSQSQGGAGSTTGGYGQQQSSGGYGQSSSGYGSQPAAGASFGAASLFVPGTSGDWWPADLRYPDSTGAQNGVRYAYFAQARRLAIDVGGTVTVYDTLDHQIGGFSQQQSVGGTLSFTSQYGLVDVGSLPVVSVNGQAPQAGAAPATAAAAPSGAAASGAAPSPAATAATQDVLATIEKLADLRQRGILTDEEYRAKKAELLGRL